MKKIVLFLLFVSFNVFAQPPEFTLNVSAVPQTCLGNGSLSFSVVGTDPAASVEYAVYLLPDTETPVTTVTANTASSLVAGNYLVIATQILNGESNTSSASITIPDNVVPFIFNTQLTHVNCGNQGVISVNVLSGQAVSYEIIAGPQTRPLQASNTFTALPVGQYQVRVYDSCGDAYVQTAQILQNQAQLWLNNYFFPNVALPGCGLVTIGQYYGNNYPMIWPVTFEYTIYPPGGGAPITVTHANVTEYNEDQSVLTDIPFYNGQQYTFDVTIIDACGNEFTKSNNVINAALEVTLELDSESCGNYFFALLAENVGLPYTITFPVAPAGFNPVLYNSSHPVSNNFSIVYGSDTNPLPMGNYTVEITDTCGNTASADILVGNQLVPVTETNVDFSCVGTIQIEIPLGTIVSATLDDAPDAYTETIPQNVTTFISSGKLMLEGLPMGEYFFTIVDICGVSYQVTVELLPPPPDLTLYAGVAAGCSEDEGSIMLNIMNSIFDTVTITVAPSSFEENLPFDASGYITDNGTFVMLSLPEGIYRFETIDKCGNQRVRQVAIQGFELFSNNTQVIRNCDSFDINVQYSSNQNIYDSFWLQKYNEVTGTWGHPQTGITYNGNNLGQSSVLLNNNQINYGFSYNGQFRIIRVVHYFGIQNNDCIEEIYNFAYYDDPAITQAYSFPCDNGLSDVVVEAVGVMPLSYAITTKNGNPFVVQNGNSNLFTGLESAVYNFQVTDACGNILNIPLNPSELGPLEIDKDGFCPGENSSLAIASFTFLNYEWYNADNPSAILSTTNTLLFPDYDPANDNGTYMVRIYSSVTGSCIDVVVEQIVEPNPLPNAGVNAAVSVCPGTQINLNTVLEEPFDENGIWEDTDTTGGLTGSLFNTSGLQPGSYNFKYIVSSCDITDEAIITVTVIARPTTPTGSVESACIGGNIELSANTLSGATYQWNGPNGFVSTEQNPVIAGAIAAANGLYIVRVTVNGCTSLPGLLFVSLSPVPEFSIQGNTTICIGQTSELSIVPQNFDPLSATYTWYHNNVLQPATTSTVVVNQGGIYNVLVTNGNCTEQRSIEVIENTEPFTIVLEKGCREENYILSVINLPDLAESDFQWTGPDGFSGIGHEIDITGLPAGEYMLSVTNSEGCTATTSVNVSFTTCSVLDGIIPKGISPGNTSDNNYFDLSGLDIKQIRIFNRFGQKVYEKENYTNEWFGQSDKGELPTGTYYYSIEFGDGKNKTGWVYLQKMN